MMRSRGSRVCLCIGAALLAASPQILGAENSVTRGPVVSGDLGAKVDEYLTRLTAFGFSGALIATKDGEVVVSKGYGLANRERRLPATLDTVFTIGSITKQFTGAAILKLEMQDKLSVNDPITKHFDNVPKDKAGITIHHLLTHTAGLVDGLGGDFDLKATREWVFKEAMKSKLMWAPGTRHQYSNLGYSLLGMIVEKTSGQAYEQFLREHLFKPAGMIRTGYLLPKFKLEELAVGYRDGEPWGTVIGHPMLTDGPCWNLRANGGIHSTIGDMYGWHLALEGNAILSDEAKKKYFAPHVDEGYGDSFYGYGWVNFKTQRGTRLLAHNGGNMIFSADFRWYVDEDVMFFLASNVSEFFVDPVSSQIARVIFGHPHTLPPKTMDLDATTFARYVGEYSLPGGGRLTVTAADGGLALAPKGQNAFTAVALGRPVPTKRAEELNARTATIIERSAKGDYAPLHQAFGGELSLNDVAEMERKEWEERQTRLGPFKAVEVLGTVPYRMRMAATVARLEFEHEAEFVGYGWGRRALMGVRSLSGPPRFRFMPTSDAEFVQFSLESPDVLRITFRNGPGGAVNALMVNRKGGDVVADKVK